jgi:glycosyltransferase involved in cell wall biosynthesis
METLSVIIPTKNEAECLPRLLAALARQSMQPQEIIVADAQSTDNTREVARSFGARVVEGGLPGVGRNRGAEHATGSVLLFLDADVTLMSDDFLAKALGEFVERKLTIASVSVCLPEGAAHDKVAHEMFNAYVRLWGARRPHAAGCCMFVKKELHQKIGGFDEQIVFCEDHEFAGRAVRNGANFGFLHVKIGLNTRRQELEGRIKLVLKYVLAEMHLMFLGPIRHDRFRYRFDYTSSMQRPLWLRALARMMLCCAAFHMISLAVAAVITGKWYVFFSIFWILDFGAIFPGIETSPLAAAGGLAMLAVLFWACYVWAKRDTASW